MPEYMRVKHEVRHWGGSIMEIVNDTAAHYADGMLLMDTKTGSILYFTNAEIETC